MKKLIIFLFLLVFTSYAFANDCDNGRTWAQMIEKIVSIDQYDDYCMVKSKYKPSYDEYYWQPHFLCPLDREDVADSKELITTKVKKSLCSSLKVGEDISGAVWREKEEDFISLD